MCGNGYDFYVGPAIKEEEEYSLANKSNTQYTVIQIRNKLEQFLIYFTKIIKFLIVEWAAQQYKTKCEIPKSYYRH